MSNLRLIVYLTMALAFFVAMAVRDFHLYGSFAGFGAVFWLLPILFILSLMFAIACGLRSPGEENGENGFPDSSNDVE